MNEDKIIIIDLSASRISAVAAEVLKDNSVRIVAEESKPAKEIRHGIVEQMSGAAFSINGVVKLLQNRLRISEIPSVSVSINAKSMKHASYSYSRGFKSYTKITDEILSSMSEEVENIFKQNDVDVFDVLPVAYELDGKSYDDPIGKAAYEIVGKYTLVVGNGKIRENLERCFDRTGLKLSSYQPTAIEAISLAVLDDEEKEEGCALIHFGHSTTTLAIYAEGALQHLMVVPLGGQNITRDIQELGISELNAERLKCLKGSALKNKVEQVIKIKIPAAEPENEEVLIATDFLATIIEARLEEICHPIFEAIANSPFELTAGIVITGGASKLNHIVDFITEQTEIYTRVGDHSDWLSDDSDKIFCDPGYSQLVGTILLIDEYNKEHPETQKKKEPEKEPKIKKRGLKDKLMTGVIRFFEDDNKME